MTASDVDLLLDSVLCPQTWPDHGGSEHPSSRAHICVRPRGDHAVHECGCDAILTTTTKE